MKRSPDLSKLLDELPRMDRQRLSQLWIDCFGVAPTPGLSLSLMPSVLAFQLQARAHGLPINLARQNSSSGISAESASQRRSLYRPGTLIVREWNGEIHEVQVTTEGYQYKGQKYRSLSPIANRITGTRWSGPMFFGTKRKGQGR